MRTVGIIQARMGSTRLPKKSMMLLMGKPLIWHVIQRVKRANLIDEVVLAIPYEEAPSRKLIEVARICDVTCTITEGDPSDLLKRYHHTAKAKNAEVVVRVPGDNPCVDPDEIDRIILAFFAGAIAARWDLWTNLDQDVLCSGYPGGLGAEVYFFPFLKWLHETVKNPVQREHPHRWPLDNGRARTIACPPGIERPDLRFDVNTIEDFRRIEKLYENVYTQNPRFTTKDLLFNLALQGEEDGK